MAPLLSWLSENWFSALQGIGIIGGIAFAAVSLRRETRARRLTDLLTLTSQHRDLWSEVHRRPELSRVLDPRADLLAQPVTKEEENFLLVVIVHFNTGWHLARENTFLSLDVLAQDARSFFSLPIPHAVWHETKRSRDPKFVEFIEDTVVQPPG